MNPLARFEFSQSSLQDYVDCSRRFQLRYLHHIAWPALPVEPALENERHLQRGERFHHLVQQYLVGVPADRLSRMAAVDPDEHLLAWWEHFLRVIPPQITGDPWVEYTLAAPLSGYRLKATYDLILRLSEGCVTIYDWKTSMRRPRSALLRARLQTRVYPFLLVQAGAGLAAGCAVDPAQIEMIYWFADPAHSPEHIAYSQDQFAADEQYISRLISEISRCSPEDFEMTQHQERCCYCVYRSLCNRGDRAGQMESDGYFYEEPDLSRLDFDLEQIAEIRF